MTAPTPQQFIQGQGTVSADNLNTFVQTVTNVAQLRSLIGLPGMQILLEGISVPGDGGAGPFYWNTTATGPDDGVNTIVPQPGVAGAWVRLVISQTSIVVISSIASLRTLDGGPSIPAVYVEGYSTIDDGGEGVFVYDASDTTSADNGGTIIIDATNHRYIRETNGQPISAQWFGATGNGSTDDTTSFQNFLSYIQSGQPGYIPAGTYKLSAQLTATISPKTSFVLSGTGIDTSILEWNSGQGLSVVIQDENSSIHIHDMTYATSSINTGTGLSLTQSLSSVLSPAYTPPSELTNLGFRDAVNNWNSATNYFETAISISSVSNITYINIIMNGESSVSYATLGTGISLVGSSGTASVVHNFISVTANSLGYGLVYGAYVQGVTLTGCNFTGTHQGILVPVGATSADQLCITNSQFNCAPNQSAINFLSAIAGVMIVNNLIIIQTGGGGISCSGAVNGTVAGNEFQEIGTTGTGTGINVGDFAFGLCITDNTFLYLNVGISLVAGSTGCVIIGNSFGATNSSILNFAAGSHVIGGILTYNVVTGSRTFSTLYGNNNGDRVMFVNIIVSNGTGTLTGYLGVQPIAAITLQSGFVNFLSFPVPSGVAYQISSSGTNPTIDDWIETV